MENMPIKKTNEKYWVDQISKNLENNKTIFRSASIKKEAAYLNPVDEIFQKLICASEEMDGMGLEITAALTLQAAETIYKETAGEAMPEEKKEEPKPVEMADLESEVGGV